MKDSLIKKFVNHIERHIESFENEKFLQKNESRNIGIIYTPNQVVDYIVSNIFRIYFERYISFNKDAKDEPNLKEIVLSVIKDQKTKENLTKIIRNIRILDPSCGSGRFLISVAEKLYQLYRILEPNFSDFDIKKAIIEKNLYGIEIEYSAILISKLRLIKWVLSFNENNVIFKTLNSEILNLKNVDQIVEKLDLHFNFFNLDYLLEFSSDKFDIITGNPPYIENKKIKDIEFKKKLTKRFNTAYRLFDLSVVFIEKSFELLKSNSGCLSMLTTNKFLSADYGIRIRKLLINNTTLKEIINISSIPIFRKTAAYPIIISFKKVQPNEGNFIRIKHFVKLNDFLENRKVKSKFIPQNLINIIPTLVFPIFGNFDLINYLYTNFLPFSQTFKDLKLYYRPFGFLNWAKHLNNIKSFRNSDKDLLLVGTGNVGRYYIKFEKPIKIAGKNLNVSYFQFNKEYEKVWAVLKSEKLIFREIDKHLTWVYDPGLFANVTGLYLVHLPSINRDTLFCILTIMNSELMDLTFRSLFGTLHMSGGYLRYNGSFIKRLPMPNKFPAFLSQLGKMLQLISQLKYDFDSYRPEIVNNPELDRIKKKYYKGLNSYFNFFNRLSNSLVKLLYFDDFYLKSNLDYNILREMLDLKIEPQKVPYKFLIPRFNINNYELYQLNELDDILAEINKLYNQLYNNMDILNQIDDIIKNNFS